MGITSWGIFIFIFLPIFGFACLLVANKNRVRKLAKGLEKYNAESLGGILNPKWRLKAENKTFLFSIENRDRWISTHLVGDISRSENPDIRLERLHVPFVLFRKRYTGSGKRAIKEIKLDNEKFDSFYRIKCRDEELAKSIFDLKTQGEILNYIAADITMAPFGDSFGLHITKNQCKLVYYSPIQDSEKLEELIRIYLEIYKKC